MEVVWWLGGEAKRRAIRRGRALQFASPIESKGPRTQPPVREGAQWGSPAAAKNKTTPRAGKMKLNLKMFEEEEKKQTWSTHALSRLLPSFLRV
eukprot:scaffold180_cov311-Pinguiococcus_pyrenoidosus.AAC.51